MQIRKAVITAAAPNQNTLPLQRLVDRNGSDKTALQLIIEEIIAAGVEEICVVVQPGDRHAYQTAAGEHLGLLTFVEQPEPLGYGDALYRTREFIGREPFLHLVGDHLYLSDIEIPCAKQLIDVAQEFECSVSAVQATRENKLPYFGVIAGRHVPRRQGIFEVQRLVEKPTPTQAEQELITAGLRSGYYLCFFGMHVLMPDVLDALEQIIVGQGKQNATLSDGLIAIAQRQRYMAVQIQGSRYNIGVQYGLLIAQLAIAFSGKDRDQILTEMVELLAHRPEAGRLV